MNIEGDGIVEPEVGEHEYEEDVVINILAKSAEGWGFKEWIGAVQDRTTKETTINMDRNKLITAVFEKEDDVTNDFYEVNGKVLDGRKDQGLGNVVLSFGDGVLYGTWEAEEWGSNRYWYVEPDIEIGPGQYRVIDSDNSTWSHNSESENQGFAFIGGLFIREGIDEGEGSEDLEDKFAGGDGTFEDSFLIATAKQLDNVRYYPEANLAISDSSSDKLGLFQILKLVLR